MNFKEQAFVERLLALEKNLESLKSGQIQLLKKIVAVEEKKNPQKFSTFSEKREVTGELQSFIDEKVRSCRHIIFTLETLKLDFEKELFHVRQDGRGYSDYYCHKEELSDLEDLIKDFHDIEDEGICENDL